MDGRRQASNESGSVNSVNQEFRWAHNVEWLVKRGDFSATFKWEMSEYISEEVKMGSMIFPIHSGMRTLSGGNSQTWAGMKQKLA